MATYTVAHLHLCRDIDDLRQVLMINVVGTFAVTKAFLPMLKSGNKKTIVNISSDAACLTLMYSMIHAKDGMDAGMGLSYKASKCAVNMGKQHLLHIDCNRTHMYRSVCKISIWIRARIRLIRIASIHKIGMFRILHGQNCPIMRVCTVHVSTGVQYRLNIHNSPSLQSIISANTHCDVVHVLSHMC